MAPGLGQIGLQAVLQDENFQAGLKRYQQGIGQMEQSTERGASVVSRLGSVMSGALTVGIGVATAAFGAFVGASAKGLDELERWGEGLDTLGDRFGLTGSKASGFAFLASKVGAPVEELGFSLNSLTNGLQGIEDRLKSGSKTVSPFEQALSKLGISAFKSNGKLKTFDEILPSLMDGFKKLPSGIQASSIAMDIFGTRGGSKMLDFLRQGSEGLVDATEKARLYGLELSGEETDAIENFGFAQNELKLAIQGAWVSIGRAVLPVARQFTDLLIRNMPRITEFAQKLGQAFTAIVKGFSEGNWNPIINILDKAIGRDASNRVAQFVIALQHVVDTFRTGGLSKALDQIGKELSSAFAGFDLATTLGDLGGKIVSALQTAWTKISPELAKWGGQFWGWLTGKGGALEQAATQLGKVATAITDWVKTNAPDWIKTFDLWKTSFWNWLTDPKGGVVADISKKLVAVTDALKTWSTSKDAEQKFIDVGKNIAQTIIDGIAALFSSDPTANGENVFVTLGRSLGKSANDLHSTFQNIGSGIAQGIIEGIAMKFGFDKAGAQAAAQNTVAWLNRYVDFMIKWGTPAAIATRLFENFLKAWNDLISAWQKLSAPSFTLPGPDQASLGKSIGAPLSNVSSTVNNNNSASTSRTISVTNNLTGFTGSSLGAKQVAEISQQIADATVRAVLSAA